MDNQLVRKVIEIRRNDMGSIIEPRLHDGLLTRIELIGDDRAELAVTSEDGSRFELSLLGLVRLKATDFLQGNIILDAVLYRGNLSNPALLEAVLGMTQEEAKSTRTFHETLTDIRSGSLALLELQPSYGCYLLALCREVVAYEVS